MARINKQTAKLATQLKEAWGRPEEGMRVGIVIGEIRDGLVQQYSEERYPDLPLKGTGRHTHSRHALAARYNPKRLN